jgi:hypothetical protein
MTILESEKAIKDLIAAIKAAGPHIEALHNHSLYSPTSEGFTSLTELRAAALELGALTHDMIWGADEDEDEGERAA